MLLRGTGCEHGARSCPGAGGEPRRAGRSEQGKHNNTEAARQEGKERKRKEKERGATKVKASYKEERRGTSKWSSA